MFETFKIMQLHVLILECELISDQIITYNIRNGF